MVGNLFWGMQFAPFSHKTALNRRSSLISLVSRKNGAKPHRHYFDCRGFATNLKKIVIARFGNAESWQSTHFCDSKNDKNQSRVSVTLKALSGAGVGVVREGEGSDFAIRKNLRIQAPTPSLKKNARGQKGEFNADLSAESCKKIDTNLLFDSCDLDCHDSAFAESCNDAIYLRITRDSTRITHESTAFKANLI